MCNKLFILTLPDLLSCCCGVVDGTGMQRSRITGCLASGLVELELQYVAHEVPKRKKII